MELQLHRPGEHNFIHSVTDSVIRVVETEYTGALILTRDRIIENWSPVSATALAEQDFLPLFELEPEIVILGTGRMQVFPPPALMMGFYSRGIGIEAMGTQAAARTFNVLVSEERNVAAALLPLKAGELNP